MKELDEINVTNEPIEETKGSKYQAALIPGKGKKTLPGLEAASEAIIAAVPPYKGVAQEEKTEFVTGKDINTEEEEKGVLPS